MPVAINHIEIWITLISIIIIYFPQEQTKIISLDDTQVTITLISIIFCMQIHIHLYSTNRKVFRWYTSGKTTH